MSRLVSIIEIHLKPQRREDYLAAAHDLIDRHRAETGILRQDIHVDPLQSNRCLVIIEWRDAQAQQKHFAAPNVRAFQAATEQHLSQPVIHRSFTLLSEQCLL